MLCRALLFLSARLAAGGASASPIVFNGIISQAGVVKVSLYNPNTGDARWIVVGKKFGSYTVERYQPGVPGKTTDAVVLTLGTSSQRIILQGSASNLSTNTPVVAPTGAQTSQDAARASLADALARARSDPNTDPRLIQVLEISLSAAKQSLTDQDDDIASSTAASRRNNPEPSWAGVGVRPDGTTENRIINSDRSATILISDANGSVKFIEQFTPPDANGTVLSRTIYSAPNASAPAPAPAAAK
jgi:hypothetical protein